MYKDYNSNRFGSNQNSCSRHGSQNIRSNGYRQQLQPISKLPANLAIRKDFYTSFNIQNSYSFEEIDRYLKQEMITVKGINVPKPLMDFNQYPWPKFISNGFNILGYKKPTPIQAQGWAIALSGIDMVGIAMTGSGKTLSYILPAFVHIEYQYNERRSMSCFLACFFLFKTLISKCYFK